MQTLPSGKTLGCLLQAAQGSGTSGRQLGAARVHTAQQQRAPAAGELHMSWPHVRLHSSCAAPAASHHISLVNRISGGLCG